MNILLDKVSKQYNGKWIFKGVTYNFTSGNAFAVIGKNGSGKSTLLKIISGYSLPTEGKIIFSNEPLTPPFSARGGSASGGGGRGATEEIYRHISVSSPHIELVEEFSLREIITFQSKFKPFRNNIPEDEILEILQMVPHRDKPVKHFSSGMKQRVQLALAILADTPVLLLDEPLSNLDDTSVKWYSDLIAAHLGNRTVIVFSNRMKEEYGYCTKCLNLEEYGNL